MDIRFVDSGVDRYTLQINCVAVGSLYLQSPGLWRSEVFGTGEVMTGVGVQDARWRTLQLLYRTLLTAGELVGSWMVTDGTGVSTVFTAEYKPPGVV